MAKRDASATFASSSTFSEGDPENVSAMLGEPARCASNSSSCLSSRSPPRDGFSNDKSQVPRTTPVRAAPFAAERIASETKIAAALSTIHGENRSHAERGLVGAQQGD